MIKKIVFHDHKKTAINWWTKVPAFQPLKELEFSKGLNIIWGPNGCGKSTILRLIGKMFHAEQGHFTLVSEDSLRNLFPFAPLSKEPEDLPKGAEFIHDGQGICFFDPAHRVGVSGGSFDWDVLEGDEGQKNFSLLLAKGSSGQMTLAVLQQIFETTTKKDKLEPKFKINKKYLNDLWCNRVDCAEKFFKPSCDLGPITYLLDEPDRSLDIPNQKKLWEVLAKISRLQLIVASHSMFAVNIPGAKYIELNEGYLNKCREAISSLGK